MERDRVPLLHRLGGGGTALLSPGMLVLALVTSAASPFRNREYARRVNSWVAATLNRLGVTDVTTEGTADLAVHGRKILGSSVYRSGEIFFYQSSLLVSNDLSLFTRYLTFPSLAPDYRQGRGHEAFCATLHGLGHRLPLPVIRQEIEAECRERLGPLE
jgi:lipoate-protein ligase A